MRRSGLQVKVTSGSTSSLISSGRKHNPSEQAIHHPISVSRRHSIHDGEYSHVYTVSTIAGIGM